MAISKKERSLSIWIGIAIGVALSSLLVRYALQKKAEQTNERLGNYESMKCASDGTNFEPIPEEIRNKIPHGIVVYFENNQTTMNENSLYHRSWTIETAGAFRSERLFIMARETSTSPTFENNNYYKFYRAAELYILPRKNTQLNILKSMINQDEYKIIGENSQTGEWIIQIRDFTPQGIRESIQSFIQFETVVSEVNRIPWTSNR